MNNIAIRLVNGVIFHPLLAQGADGIMNGEVVSPPEEDIGFSTTYDKSKAVAVVNFIQKIPPMVNIECKVNGSIINVVNFIKNTGNIIPGMNLYLDFDKSKTHLFYLNSGDLVS